MIRALVGGTLAMVVLSAAPSTRAADAANVQEAGALFKEGVRLFKEGDFEHARVKFTAANGLVKSSDILWNLAVAEAKSGHAVDAINHFRAYEREPKARPGDVSEAEKKWIPLLDPQVGELEIDGAEGGEVTIDGGDVGLLPMRSPVAVTPRQHHVEGRVGAEVVARDVTVGAGQSIAVHLILAPPAAAAPPVAPVAPPLTPAAPPPPAAADPPPVEETRPAPLRLWLTVGFGVASAATLASGIYFATQSTSEANSAQQIRSGIGPGGCSNPAAPGCASLSSALGSENSDHTASIVLYTSAGVLAAGAIASWLFLPKTVHSRVVAMPYFAPGVIGAEWAAHF